MRITAVMDFLSEEQRERVRKNVEVNGCQIRFFTTSEEAETCLPETDILWASDPALPGKTPNLKWVCTPFAGIDRFCQAGILPEGVLLSNSSGAYGVAISEHILMVTLELLRRQPEYDRAVSRKEWIRDLPIRSIRGSRILLIGTGDIGRNTAERLRAFGPASIVGCNRSGVCSSKVFDRLVKIEEGQKLEAELRNTDILILSLPATPETRELLSADRIACLPAHAIVINVGRGNTLDQDALLLALKDKKIAGAALDVFSREPIPEDDPAWTTENLLITPHISGNMALGYTVDRCVDMFLEDVDNFCSGKKLLHLADPGMGY